jgi:Domain of unknown function (DUF3854)
VSKVEWVRVTPQHPCPYCEKSDERCAASKGGEFRTCYRVGGEGAQEKRDAAGVLYYVHKLSADLSANSNGHTNGTLKPRPAGKAPGIADPARLDEVYRALLDHPALALTAPNRADLVRRGFPADEIDRRGYRSMPARRREEIAHELAGRFGVDVLLHVPGFFRNNREQLSIACLPGLLIPVRDARGRIAALMVRPNEKLDTGGKYLFISSKNRGGPGPEATAHVPLGIEGPVETVRLTEGQLKADLATALSGMPTAGAPGVGNWRCTLPVLKELGARTVRLAFDADWRRKPKDVARPLLECGRALVAAGFALELELWDEALGKGVDDVMAAGKVPEVLAGEKALAALQDVAGIAETEGSATSAEDGKPTIIVESTNLDDSLGKWTGQALQALEKTNEPPSLFQKAGLLVRLRCDDDAVPSIEPLTLDALRGVLDRSAHWGEPRSTKKGGVRIKYGPPRTEIVRDFASRPGWEPRIIPFIEAVVESPRFLPDGRLMTTPGYHAGARIYYKPPPGLRDLRIPDHPRAADVEGAIDLIFDELLVDFPFADPASRANAVACMVVPFVRMMIPGPTPLHLFEASTEGTGKGKLANACASPSLNHDLVSTSQKECEAEWRKAITTALIPGPSHVFIDNMHNPKGWDDTPVAVDSASLALALTQPYWQDRILGGNTEVRLKVACIWMASGNNVEWSKELARRIVTIRLVAPTENPSERTGFRHDPLEVWIVEHRIELLRACLILCQNWIAAGRPPGQQTMGSYESYARVVGGILEAAGIPGFLQNRAKVTGKDRESTRWPALVAAWQGQRGRRLTSGGDLWEIVTGDPELALAFADILGDGKELSQKQRLGRQLAKQQDRVWGEFRIVRGSAKTLTGSPLYRVVPASEDVSQGDEDEGDSVPI